MAGDGEKAGGVPKDANGMIGGWRLRCSVKRKLVNAFSSTSFSFSYLFCSLHPHVL